MGNNYENNSIWNKTLYTTCNGKNITVKTVLCIIGIIIIVGITFKFVADIGIDEGRHSAWYK